ncbi:MAG: tRNA 2-thiocytidine biosynthesis protein TtcA [Clostridia bacterium]|nr:tRNA 2-thiocytidine biosynthesis protein TtcA [Clostridia bacterium]
MSYMRAAMERYDMIEQGDCVAVGVSGGKDSVAMLCALAEMRRFYPKAFEIKAISVDPCFFGKESDFSAIEQLCARLDVEYIIKRTNLYHIIFETRKESNPCSLCARMRRGLLHDAAKAAGCNKIALGHHMDDAAQTVLMNLFRGGRFACFSPKSYLSRKDLYMIRPMIYVPERYIENLALRESLPVLVSACPADGNTARQDTAALLQTLGKDYESLPDKILHALQTDGISGW